MSASRAAAETCANCGADLPREARFCPECGSTVDPPSGATLRAELPPDETGPVPVAFSRSEPHWFGVAPPGWLLGGGAGAFLLALVLFAGGRWPYGLIFLGVSALLLAAFLEAARRRPRSAVTRVSAGVRERAASLLETWRVRWASAIELRRLESGLAVIKAERSRRLFELGDAAHRGDGRAEAGARARLKELDEHEAELRRRQAEGLRTAGERIRRARLSVEQTMLVAPSEPEPGKDDK
jgi:zinc ribbon protein